MHTFLTTHITIFSICIITLITAILALSDGKAYAQSSHKVYACSKTLNGTNNPYYSKDICNFCSNGINSESQCTLKVAEMIETCTQNPALCESAKVITSGLGAPAASETVAAEPGAGLYAGEPVEPEYTEVSPQIMPQAQKPGVVNPGMPTGGGGLSAPEVDLNAEFEAMMGDQVIQSEAEMKAALAKFAGQMQNKNGLGTSLAKGLMMAQPLQGAAVNKALSKLSNTSAWRPSEVSTGEVHPQANNMASSSAGTTTNTPSANVPMVSGNSLNAQWCTVDGDCNEPGTCCSDNACVPCNAPPTTPPQTGPQEQTSWSICKGPTAQKYMSDCDAYEGKTNLYSQWNVMGAKGGIRMPYYNKDGMAVPPGRINIVWEGPEAEVHFCLCQGGACDNTGCVMPADGSGDPNIDCPGNYVEAPKYKCDEPSPVEIAEACGISYSGGIPNVSGTYGKLTGGYCESLYDKCDYGLICPDGGEAHVSTDCVR